jgi:hypothetical protein
MITSTKTDRQTTDLAEALAEAWHDYCDEADLTETTLTDLIALSRRLIADGYDRQRAIDEAVWVVADAQ